MTTEQAKKTILVFLAIMFIALIFLFSIGQIKPVYIANDDISTVLVGSNITQDVAIQDQTTRPVDIMVNRILDNSSYGLAVQPIIDTYTMTLNTTIGLNINDKIGVLEQNGMPQIYFAYIKSIDVNTITLNRPIPYNFSISNSFVFIFDNQLNVDGSITPVKFTITNSFNQAFDIVRFNFKCTDDVEMHDGLFCGIDMLENGVEIRKWTNNGYYINYFNVRNNAKWGLLSYDVLYTDTGKPPANTYGFGTRLTYGGQSKHGVVIRIEPGERIEFIVHDDLTDIGGASFMIEGSFTQT